jgi:heme-binding protein
LSPRSSRRRTSRRAEQSVRDYFVANPQEYAELKGIAQPLIDLQRNCDTAIQPMQVAALYQALSTGAR